MIKFTENMFPKGKEIAKDSTGRVLNSLLNSFTKMIITAFLHASSNSHYLFTKIFLLLPHQKTFYYHTTTHNCNASDGMGESVVLSQILFHGDKSSALKELFGLQRRDISNNQQRGGSERIKGTLQN